MTDEISPSVPLETTEKKTTKSTSTKMEKDGIVDSREQSGLLHQMIESNPDKIDGSAGRLLAIKDGMTLKDALAGQAKIDAQYKPFEITMDDGTSISANSRLSDSKQLIAQATPKERHSEHTHPSHEHDKLPSLVLAHEASDSFLEKSMAKIETIPKAHREWLAQHGYKIEVVKDISTYDKEHSTTYATEHPEGYPPGWTAANLDVFFDSTNNRVVILENFNRVPGSSDVMGSAARVRHETGHALDQSMNFKLQDDPIVQKMYDDAVARLAHSPVTSFTLGYYLQTPVTASDGSVSRPGLRETIAELYATMHGDHRGAAAGPNIDKSLIDLFEKTLIPYMRGKGY